MLQRSPLKRLLHLVAIYLLVSAFAAVGLLITSWPSHPRSMLGWGLLFVSALPITLIGEWLGHRVTNNRLSRVVENRTKSSELSWARIGYYLVIYVLLAVGALVVFRWFEGFLAAD